jgi:hypothetical protein
MYSISPSSEFAVNLTFPEFKDFTYLETLTLDPRDKCGLLPDLRSFSVLQSLCVHTSHRNVKF